VCCSLFCLILFCCNLHLCWLSKSSCSSAECQRKLLTLTFLGHAWTSICRSLSRYDNPPNREIQIPWYVAIQIQIEFLVSFQHVPRNQDFSIWWILQVLYICHGMTVSTENAASLNPPNRETRIPRHRAIHIQIDICV